MFVAPALTPTRRDGVNNSVNGAVAIYNPNGPAALIAFFAFGIAATFLLFRYYRTRPRAKYMRITIVGSFFMAIGYICRFSRRNGINAWSWLFETLCILLSPCAFLAQNYILLPRLAASLETNDCLLVGLRFIKIFFIIADLVTVFAQLAGTALTITFGDLVPIGVKLVTAALWIQLVCFIGYLSIYVVFGIRLRNRHGYRLASISQAPKGHPWQALYLTIGVSCALLLIRSIYRVAEYTAGADSALGQSEVAFYLLDTLEMFLNVVMFGVVWPATCLDPLDEGPVIAGAAIAMSHK